MKKLLLLIIIISNLFGVKKVACLGDSLTADGGYVYKLQELYTNATFDIIAAKGASVDLVFRLALRCSNYDCVILLCGVNSIDRPKYVVSMLRVIVNRLKNQGNKKIVLMTIPPWRGYKTWTLEKQWNTYIVNGYIMSRPPNVDDVVNLYKYLEDKYKKQRGFIIDGYSTDGLHWTKSACNIISILIYTTIGSKI